MSQLLPPPKSFESNIVIIGMAGAGKTTVGKLCARELGWAFADTDYLIEAAYGMDLQHVTDSMSKDEFLDIEAEHICSLDLHRAVIATGGSVVYRERSMAHLKQLGNVFFLDVPLEVILERIAMNPDRGIAITPGQTIGDLFREREALYRKYADFRIDASGLNAQECAWLIIDSWRRNCPETPEI